MTYIQPGLTVLILLLLWAWRTPDVRRKNRRILIVAVLLFLWSWPPLGWLMVKTLEAGYEPRPPKDSIGVQALVVPSGGAEVVTRPALDVRLTEDTLIRVRYSAWLYHHWKKVPILVSGGRITNAPRASQETLAGTMATALESLGVPASAIIHEPEATSTHENAIYSARLLQERGLKNVAVVTEAFHVRRAAGAYAKAGLTVVPAPCGFRGVEPPRDISAWFPLWRGIYLNETVLHEWIGLAWYKLRGRI